MADTVKGGKYINAAGDTVDANGEPIEEAQEDDEPKTLEDHTVAQLQEIAKDEEIEGYSSMKKAELIGAIEEAQEE